MGARVAHDPEGLRGFGGDDLDGGAVMDGRVEVGRSAVDLAGERGLRQARADGGCHVGDRGALGEFLDGSVGKDDVHVVSFLAPGAHKAPALISGAGRAQSACTEGCSRRLPPSEGSRISMPLSAAARHREHRTNTGTVTKTDAPIAFRCHADKAHGERAIRSRDPKMPHFA